MTPQEARVRNVQYLLQSAHEALASAASELAAARTRFAMNRAYYACFYAVSALFVAENRHFTKHGAVRAALHRDLIRPGRLAAEWGDFYDEVFEARQISDYGLQAEFDPATAAAALSRAGRFVAHLVRLCPAAPPQ